jgi:hypothetical protein
MSSVLIAKPALLGYNFHCTLPKDLAGLSVTEILLVNILRIIGGGCGSSVVRCAVATLTLCPNCLKQMD